MHLRNRKIVLSSKTTFRVIFRLNFTSKQKQFVQILLDENKTIWCVVAISIPDLATASVCVCVFWTIFMDLTVLNAF